VWGGAQSPDEPQIPDDEPELPRGCVPYLPCPANTVFRALDQARLGRADVFVDVGSGLGRVALLANLLTGAQSIGLEIQPGLVRAARARAAALHRSDVQFVQGDAGELLPGLVRATVFFFYCPFGGHRLERALEDLRLLARAHPVRVCCVEMPQLRRDWLAPLPSISPELTVYESHPA